MAEKGIKQLTSPGSSTDLKPLENLWAIMKKQLAVYKPKNQQELHYILFKTWYANLEFGLLQKLISSVSTRIRAEIKADRGATKYCLIYFSINRVKL